MHVGVYFCMLSLCFTNEKEITTVAKEVAKLLQGLQKERVVAFPDLPHKTCGNFRFRAHPRRVDVGPFIKSPELLTQ